MQKSKSIGEILEHFCRIVDDEAERQETILAVCRAQHEAALANDVPRLEVKTAALAAAMREAADAEKERSQLLQMLADYYKLPAEHRTITTLAPQMPEPWRSRLLEAQHRLRLATKASRGFVRATGRVLRWSMRAVNLCMRALDTALGSAHHVYSAGGAFNASSEQRPAFVDQKG